ncbi:uncharacterized protein BP01DRAFT_356782 [Aspergillus saccharolyticus JOP 1030-1]|uniref:Uncharacterized protein n=1 Tax=Aspergillus saccharolyticus JOP 1030-1 TaxID=1450539 RepID=A0A318ZF36_9EURO|nr:hypothetical protein BP01DRAFT_356782 [Aspergillus saccharolyticus JOP 1030-1]PYH45297.1 hypothetical protein BP01DRAFT_356782 [Aspergillus saccharolyticus JOP 1030-1]
MNSWQSSSNAGDELSSGVQPLSSWPSPYSSASHQVSPRRREHAVQPPPLTTAFSSSQFQGLGLGLGAGYSPTPLSTTSLSSPFTHGQSPVVASPGGVAIGSSPMSSRQYNVPYNPQDWGPVGHTAINTGQQTYPQTNNMLRIVPQPRPLGSHSDVSLSPPPPPYSPPSQQHQHQPRDNVSHDPSSVRSSSPSTTSSYTGAMRPSTDQAPEYQQRRLPRARPMSMFVGNEQGRNRRVSLPPPPPLPQSLSGSRSSSRNRGEPYRDQAAAPLGSRPYIVVSPEAMRAAQSNNGSHLSGSDSMDDAGRPPASRRAVSAGPVVNSASSSRAHSQTRSQSPLSQGWEPGMPLPPPPPGPPPSTRSQSVNGLSDASSVRSHKVPARTGKARAPPALGTTLDSIPPTPAGWVDETISVLRPKNEKMPLSIDTTNKASGSSSTPHDTSQTSQSSVSGGLFRSPAIKDPNAKGIRERRIERRNRQSQVLDDLSAVSMSSNPWAEALDKIKPSNLVLEDTSGDTEKTPHQASAKVTPRSTRSVGSEMQQQIPARSRASSGGLFSNRSPFSTPKAEPSPLEAPAAYAPTPPFSPGTERSKRASPALPSKALPTPPLQPKQERSPSQSSRVEDERPISHILHLPNDSVPTVSPLAPRRLSAQQGPSLDSVVKRDDEFIRNASQRHQIFIEKEADAVDEKEALELFTEFIIAESRIRREKYAKIWDTGSFDRDEVVRQLFELPPKTPQITQMTPMSVPVMPPKRASTGALPKPKLDIPQSRPESAWWNNYQPCLSPIASLGLSNDEMSSRGRAPSRWWESKTGSSSEGGERRVQRSKRESKYMGLPREALLEESQSLSGSGIGGDQDSTGQRMAYGPDEYPPEKVGWHEEPDMPVHLTSKGPSHLGWYEARSTMDVSRLITLPPPYPRHYPAVNNSHPELVTYRTLVRSITDLSEIKATRQRHETDMGVLFQKHLTRVKEGRRQFKANIQSQIQEGSITFAEAAEAEAALIVEENTLERELMQRQLDNFQETVFRPMRTILRDRIERATSCIDELQSKLFDDARCGTPDQTQEEGDEKPELLEKLTQLKWLFEARENLHREVFELISDRDEKYKAVVLLPYKQAGNDDKVLETSEFFLKDAMDRRVNHESDALARLESFLDVIEENVARGVEIQLSAFWDIAPPLLALVQQIPENLRGFLVQIPVHEYDENPSYHQHPLQYLYTLVSHAEKSSYQYIESQINLFCLLHEVKSAVMKANCSLVEAERICQGEAESKVLQELQASRADEERTLTGDLQDKVATVEGQWAEALGSQIQGLRERVKEQLMAENGWDEIEQLEQA